MAVLFDERCQPSSYKQRVLLRPSGQGTARHLHTLQLLTLVRHLQTQPPPVLVRSGSAMLASQRLKSRRRWRCGLCRQHPYDLRNISAVSKAILLNKDAIAVDQVHYDYNGWGGHECKLNQMECTCT